MRDFSHKTDKLENALLLIAGIAVGVIAHTPIASAISFLVHAFGGA